MRDFKLCDWRMQCVSSRYDFCLTASKCFLARRCALAKFFYIYSHTYFFFTFRAEPTDKCKPLLSMSQVLPEYPSLHDVPLRLPGLHTPIW